MWRIQIAKSRLKAMLADRTRQTGFETAAASGRLRRNGWAGIRMGSTGASDAAWLAGHRAAVPISRATGIASLIIGLAMVVDGVVVRDDNGTILFWVLFVIGYGGLLAATIVMAIQAHRAARAVTSPQSLP